MTTVKNYHTLRLVLGDQLNSQHHWFKQVDNNVLYVIAELKQEVTYVKHHIQKLCAFFAAMEHFANALSSRGFQVLYLTLEKTTHYSSLDDLLKALVSKYKVKKFEYQQPDEYRLQQQLHNLSFDNTITINEVDTEHFLVSHDQIHRYIKPKKHNRMETFYRKMRQQFNILMEDGQPLGGEWNYDAQNRETIKAKDLADIPQPLLFENNVSAYLKRINKYKIPYFGKAEKSLLWPISRQQSLQLLSHFCRYCLPNFGRFQDAMTANHSAQWSLYHSRLSFALNSKILHPMEVINTAIAAYQQSSDKITLPQIEGFVRQILGWREYIRCVYWANMPDYQTQNALSANQALPEYFWTADTNMNCMHHAIQQSLDYAYAHHIQRLMITGNFCLLAGIDPDEVDQWYLGIYIDAIEWVEMPNTRGMSQFADGGYVATKPYSASGNYINKMSDYCKSCHYKIKEKSTDNACPFNSLYWQFMLKHRGRLAKNPRNSMIYRNWDKQSPEKQQATLTRAQWCLDNIEKL